MSGNVPGRNALTPDERGNLIGELAGALAGGLGLPEFIAADPASLPAYLRPVQAGQRAYCRVFSRTGADEALVGNYADSLCSGYLAPDQQPQRQPGDPPPFTGGQCPGVSYLVNYQSQNQQNVTQGSRTVTGPVEFVGFVYQENGPCSRFGSPGTSWTVRFQIRANGGIPLNILVFSGQCYTGGNSPQDEYFLISATATRTDGQPDDCGSLPSDPPFYDPAPNPFVEPPGGPDYDPGDGTPLVDIDVGLPSVDIDGNINIPITVDGIGINIGAPANGPLPDTPTPDPGVDTDNPSDPQNPGPGGAGNGDDNPDDGVDFDGAVAVVVVTVTQQATNLDREVGGASITFGKSENGTPGWFKWKFAGGLTEPRRLRNGVNTFVYSRGPCTEADGYQVKFSLGNSGFAVSYRCEEPENNAIAQN